VPYKGAVVKGLSADELVHVYDTRLLLEVEAVRRGVLGALFESDLDLMRQEYEGMRRAVADERVADLLDHDERLLSILYAAAGNPVILEIIRTLWQRCRPYKIAGVHHTLKSGDSSVLLVFQKRLLDAAAANDAEAAARIHKESIMNATARIRQVLPHAPTPI
jgi:DNA-binding GntR family transcriptional regulator